MFLKNVPTSILNPKFVTERAAQSAKLWTPDTRVMNNTKTLITYRREP